MIKQDTSENQANTIYLAIGSNLGNRVHNIEKAKFLLIKNNISLISVSKYYETPSWPNPKNPKFINIVLKAKSLLNPLELLNLCKTIEISLGRKITPKNSPRECDIDIVDFNGLIKDSKDLVLPHPRAHLRNFVLYPLNDINSNWKHPIINKKIDFFIKKLNFEKRNEITRMKESVIIDS